MVNQLHNFNFFKSNLIVPKNVLISWFPCTIDIQYNISIGYKAETVLPLRESMCRVVTGCIMRERGDSLPSEP